MRAQRAGGRIIPDVFHDAAGSPSTEQTSAEEERSAGVAPRLYRYRIAMTHSARFPAHRGT